MTKAGTNKEFSNTVLKKKWERIGKQKRSGVTVPLFSVFSKDSTGIGDLNDLKLLIDWCVYTGNSIIQLLPMNDVGSTFCPYDSVTSFGLEPLYISLDLLSSELGLNILKDIDKIRKMFPMPRQRVDYSLKKAKVDLLWGIFSQGAYIKNDEFLLFQKDNKYWLDDFALFKALKYYYNGAAWYDWEDKYKKRNKPELDEFLKQHASEVLFEKWMQWQLYRQFKQVKEYAVARNILIKGDLPILVSRDSADVWSHPEFFKLDFAAGAPPDMYCAKGQRWGTPTYNWERIAADNYLYLKEKLKYSQNFYDILRIDHVVGLFRIWSIPYNEPIENQGLNGFFDPGDEKKWEKHGRDILLTMLGNTDMFLCAEDLGVIPKVCTDTLKELGIPGNDVQRWVKDWKTKHDFLPSDEYRMLSVAVLSTHDTTNWPAWWENEAGTMDENLFNRRCVERGIDVKHAQERLFDSARSEHGRLRWKEDINSVDALVNILGKKREEVADFIDFYKNTYLEKEKLWKQLNLSGPMREKYDPEVLSAVLRIVLESRAIFSIQLIIDLLYLDNIFSGDT
ncbi:MAG: 4-alpha-glucanotransferase, partial [Candidatus Omnitrophica bacterium]|nr:4-alpha-glucanotransferase [Candidatus Omnitrophota bacterium]